VSSWGESHGKALGCIVDGCPSSLPLKKRDVQKHLDRRKPGQSDVSTSRSEGDEVKFLSGVFEGKTIGTPISLMVENKDVDSSKYIPLKDTPRPSHADYTYMVKYGHVDWRGGSRASARETVARVAAGGIADKLLTRFGVQVLAYTKQIGSVRSDETLDSSMKGVEDLVYSNDLRVLDSEKQPGMREEIEIAKKQKDSVGGVVECVALEVPEGIGEPVFDKLEADLAKAVASIPACRGVEFGAGFQLADMRGSQANDSGRIKRKNHSSIVAR